jgi:uncharacterized protein (UPF0335 family)
MTDTHGAANSLAGIAEPFVERIENVHKDLETLKGEYMQRCQARREDIKQIYTDAADNGVNRRALKGVVKARALQRKIDGIDDDFEPDEAAAYLELAKSLGPLGHAAAERAGFAEDDGADDSELPTAEDVRGILRDDLRPAFMKDPEKAEAHEAGLKTVGRGRPKKAKAVDAIA